MTYENCYSFSCALQSNSSNIRMQHCISFGCNFQLKWNKRSDISLHSFPADKKMKKDCCCDKDLWLGSWHFSSDAFDTMSWLKLLRNAHFLVTVYKQWPKPNVLPTVFSKWESEQTARKIDITIKMGNIRCPPARQQPARYGGCFLW